MRFERRTALPHSADQVYRWHTAPGAFERLCPPWQRLRLVEPHPGVHEGSRAVFDLRVGPAWVRWVARHTDIIADRQFVDVMERGPFASWRHRHAFEPNGAAESTLIDEIEFSLPLAPLSNPALGQIDRDLARTFRYRHDTTAADLALHASFPTEPPLKVAITGASGLIGHTLAAMLRTGGHTVVPMVRREPGPGERRWDPKHADPAAFEGIDAVVHLAGENIAGGRWSAARQAEIRRSRAAGTTSVATAIKQASNGPRILISASAIGFYGDRGDALLDETAPGGSGFLADVVREWEGATAVLDGTGVRVVLTRFAPVLTPAGGALGKMLPPFRLGLGGPMGTGRQWMSWISIDDCAGALIHLLHSTAAGPVNLVAPEPVTNATFASTLGRVLRRPAVLPVPAPLLRVALGRLADEGLLASTRVSPALLTADGYRFRHPTLEGALRHLLGRVRS